MLYNRIKNKIRTSVDCTGCVFFNRKTKTCEGLGKTCFEYDEQTKTAIDPVTKLPIRLEK